MNDICGACAGSCCSFKTLGISYCDIPDGTSLEMLLYGRAASNPEFLTQLLRADGSLPDMRFFDARDTETGGRFLLFDCHHVKDGRCGIYRDRPVMCRMFLCPALKGEEKLGVFLRTTYPRKFRRLRDVTDQVQAALREVAQPAFRKQARR